MGLIFLGQNIAKSDIFGSNKTKTVVMIFLTPNIVTLIFLGSLEAILTDIRIVLGYFLFMYGFLSIK